MEGFSLEDIMLNKSDLNLVIGSIENTLNNSSITVDNFVRNFLMVLGIFVAVFGFLGNLLTLIVIIGYKKVRCTQNAFIFTLTFSDLFQCLVTMPLRLWELLHRQWPLGLSTEWLCKLMSVVQAFPVFMSSLAIMSIAVHRYRCILQPNKSPFGFLPTTTIFLSMVLTSFLLSYPLFLGFKLKSYVNFENETFLNSHSNILICIDMRSPNERYYYNIGCTLVQFLIPFVLVLVIYALIYRRLRLRIHTNHEQTLKKRKKTNRMLIYITLLFFMSWLPINIMNITLEYHPSFIVNHHVFIYGLCYLCSLLNACFNPLLYQYFNKKYFVEFFEKYGPKSCRKRNSVNKFNVGLNELSEYKQKLVVLEIQNEFPPSRRFFEKWKPDFKLYTIYEERTEELIAHHCL